MSGFIGFVLNVLFLATAYMSYTVGGLWDNGYNVMLALYCVITGLVVFTCVAMINMSGAFVNSKGVTELSKFKDNLLKWYTLWFWVVALPSLAFVGWWCSFLVVLTNLSFTWIIKATAKETIKQLEELCKSENITFEEMLDILDSKK